MKRFLKSKKWILTGLSVVVLLMRPAVPSPAAGTPFFDVITVSSAITPPAAQYILQNIEASAKAGAQGLIILLDTPGGLDTAMRDIAKGILNAPIPVMVFVYPSGARAASAGAWTRSWQKKLKMMLSPM